MGGLGGFVSDQSTEEFYSSSVPARQALGTDCYADNNPIWF